MKRSRTEPGGSLAGKICVHLCAFVVPLALAGFVALLLLGAMFWARGRDPFQRIWFKVKASGVGKAECIAVMPKLSLKSRVQSPKSRGGESVESGVQSPKSSSPGWPVVVYLHGSGGSVLGSGNELRQMAEMGLAAVGMEYCQTNEAVFEAQFTALLEYLQRQKWADTNRIAWVGFSLGAQRELSFLLRHPERPPNLLVRLAGGWVPELESQVQSLASKVKSAGSGSQGVRIGPSTLNPQPSTLFLLVHGEQDEVFPLADARRVAACLQTNGIPVELRMLPGEGHGFGANRLLVFRVVGEQCLLRLEGADALAHYRSILAWQARAKPLWLFWTPALAWAVVCLWLRRKVGQASRLPFAGQLLPHGSRGLRQGAGETPALLWRDIALRCAAAGLALAALAQTALHLVPPRLPTTDRTLAIARKHLVSAKEAGDFEFLAAQPVWRVKRLKTLLEHVELAHYNRELINWKLDDAAYQEYVLSAQIDPAADGNLDWRRPLWENFYPRIRREQSPEAAAEILVRFLRERVTIAQGNSFPTTVREIWQRQIANERGFEALYVAALRSVGVPARLSPQGHAELWTGSTWQAAPRPLIGR